MSQKSIFQGHPLNRDRLSFWVTAAFLACFVMGCSIKSEQNIPTITSTAPIQNTIIDETSEEKQSQDIPLSLRFTKIDADDGLTQSTTYVVVQDDLGFMWFGTEDGLIRYDGYKFNKVTIQSNEIEGQSDQWINALVSAGNGDLWIGTRQGGLSYYHAETGLFDLFVHDELAPNSLNSNHVNVLFKDRFDRLWIGTTAGLDMLDKRTSGFTHFSIGHADEAGSESMTITGLCDDREGNLWIGTGAEGLFKLNPKTGDVIHFSFDRTDQSSLISNNIRGILPADEGSIWIATTSGLNYFTPSAGTFIRYQHSSEIPDTLVDNYIRTMTLDPNGNLWLGTKAGLDYFNTKTRVFTHFTHDAQDPKSLSNNNILSNYESKDGVLWVSTFGGYLNKYYRGMDQFAYYRHSTKDETSIGGNILFKIATDPSGVVWIASFDGGLNRFDPETGRFKVFQHDPEALGSLASNEVWSVFKDSRGILWVGTKLGLDRLDPGSNEFKHYFFATMTSPDSIRGLVYDIAESKSGDLWFGTSDGLDRYNTIQDKFTHYAYNENDPGGISGSEITKVYFDRNGTLWVGTFSSGLDRYDPAGNRFLHYRHDPDDERSLSNDSILSIYHDTKGKIWVGTDGGGLNMLNEADGTFIRYSEEDGLASNVVYGILEDSKGRLWLSTNNGLSCFDPEKGEFKNYNETDGLQGNEFNMNAYAQDAVGNMYFGGVNGLTSFNPAEITADPYVPPVMLLSVTQNGKVIEPEMNSEQQEQIILRWPQNSFEFEFASLSYVDPKKNQHAYKLESFDENWIDAGSWREGRYTNLPGGTYTLRVKGSNEDGVWNETGESLVVKVIPAFWQTLWFQISAMLLVFGSVFTIYSLRNASVKANTRELERQVGARTKEIERLFEKTKELAVVEERNRLARELHDSAKQKAFAALAQLGTANGVLPENPQSARAHLQEAENLVYEVIEELTFLIQEMYPLALKEKGLATSIREYVFDWEARTDIQVQVSIEHEKRLALNVEQAIYRSIQESLSNIARHSNATSVKIDLVFSDQAVTAEISDNGCGFDMKTRQNGMGLRTIRERIESIGGSLKIVSAPECGTCISFSAPLQSPQVHEGDKK